MHIIIAVRLSRVYTKQQSQQTDTISKTHVALHCSVVNMSKSCCFAVVLAVICLPVFVFSLEVVAQPTVHKTMTCGSSTSDDVLNIVKMIASNQLQNVKEIKEEIKLHAANPIKCEYDALEPSKQALVSALVCEYLVCFFLPKQVA